MNRLTALAALLLFPAFFPAAAQQESPLLKAMKAELTRTMTGLAGQPVPPYFLSYSVTETRTVRMSASFGNIDLEDASVSRVLDIDVRTGDYAVDNTHTIRGSRFEFGGGGRGISLPLGDDEAALRQAIWIATDRSYKKAVERYGKVKTNLAVKVKEEDSSADFSRETAAKFIEPPAAFAFDTAAWRGRIKRLSAMFAADPKMFP